MVGGSANADKQGIGLLALLLLTQAEIPLPSVTHYSQGNRREERHRDGKTEIIIPRRGAPTNVRGHLEYALKREALDLLAWHAIAHGLGPKPFQEWVQSQPTGQHARRAWYLYELLTGDELDLPTSEVSNYVPLANPDLQLTNSKPIQSQRHKVADNLLGSVNYCPLVRHTERLREAQASGLKQRTHQVVSSVEPRDLQRATDYLYHKETKASFKIEREDVSANRVERFIQALRSTESTRWYDEEELVALQNEIVDPRYRESAFRTKHIYVGQTKPWGEEQVHYPCPRPGDVRSLMLGWSECLKRCPNR